MGRIAVAILLGLLVGVGVLAEPSPYYFTRSEKALITLSLKFYLSIRSGNKAIKPEDFQRYRNTVLTQLASQPELVNVKSYQEFLSLVEKDPHFADEKLEQQKSSDLFALLRPVQYVSASPRVQRKINLYFENRIHFFKKLVADSPHGLENLAEALVESQDLPTIQEKVQKIYDQKVNELVKELRQTDSIHITYMTKLLKSYFEMLPLKHKAEIVYQLSQQPMNSDRMDLFMVMLQNAGPQLQKLMQIVGRHKDVPEKFKSLFQKLEDEVKKVPWKYVEQFLKKNRIESSNFTYLEHKPIGVGTMAQTHRVQLADENGVDLDRVFRFLKPKIDELVEMDHQILIKLAEKLAVDPELKQLNLSFLPDLIEDVHRSVAEELDIVRTQQNQVRGRKIYQRTEYVSLANQKIELEINVPRAYFFDADEKMMLQEMVIGKKLVKEFATYKEIYPELYQKVAERLAMVWVEEAFFKSGLFHVDLHQGNILARVTDEKVQVSLLDFGMIGQLTPEIQQSALVLAVAVKINQAPSIAKHFLRLSKGNSRGLTEEEFSARVQQRSDEVKRTGFKMTLDDWTSWAIQEGLQLDYEFKKLNRGISAIEILLQDSGSPLLIHDIAEIVGKKNFVVSAKNLLSEPNFKLKDFRDFLKPPPQAKRLFCKTLFR